MNKPLKRNYKTQRGYEKAMKNYNAKKDVERKQKRTKKINNAEVKNKQKLGKGINKLKKGTAKFVKTNAPKIKNNALKIAKGTVSSVKGLGLGAAAVAAEKGINQVVDRGFKQLKKSTRGKNMTLAEYRAKRDEAVKKENSTRGINRIPGAIKNVVKNTQGKFPSLADSKFNSSNIGNQPSKKKLTGKEKAQALAKKRIGRGTAKNPDKTIASVNAANKKKMRDAARKRNEAFQRNRKLKIKKRKNKNKAGSSLADSKYNSYR